MKKALPIMIQGTHSDAGKSIITTGLCRIFYQDGYKTAPFKSQNMALNSYITLDGKEIGRAQGVQAEAAKTIATTDMNPILIKPTRDQESQIVVHGKPYRNMEAGSYRKDFFETGLQLIKDSYAKLSENYDRIVIEGAGSPAEINLNDRELVNMRVANLTNAPVILVGDIEKGGVFASLVGTLQLLSEEDRKRVIGVIINKFRGDLSLLTPGLDWFEAYTGVPILGVIPYIHNLTIDAEDSVALNRYSHEEDPTKEIDIAVVRYPMISNFTDIDPFIREPDCHVRFITKPEQLKQPDIIILPGSKNTIEDLRFLKETGLMGKIISVYKSGRTKVVGICGGYQMLGESITDPNHIESSISFETGLQLLPIQTTITKEKTTTLSEGLISFGGFDILVEGYEIHMGQSTYGDSYTPLIVIKDRSDGCVSNNGSVMGTYFHGIFHNDLFREKFINEVRKMKGLEAVHGRISFNQLREDAFDHLASHIREHVKLDYIYKKMEEFQTRGVSK
ncbi:cobyric acid synthase [Schinkia azotoformans]|uniref:Cobyric acid synthase n=1 Tax=Schinkia azotoformans LMG 9581 TaxID=1131731 RepID=K6BZF2_SCHAZ|nr:cobyric acid synthase [Schinkia azotoformans]EKN64295.1 cobyric acid synthase [Schinkia azotoformans LMG 9581]MEC1637996.1 cobyric acid synthase [Schinkia azotoformans]MEC1944893.1 cobyric acid synthase [Schinkia azotoformans]